MRASQDNKTRDSGWCPPGLNGPPSSSVLVLLLNLQLGELPVNMVLVKFL